MIKAAPALGPVGPRQRGQVVVVDGWASPARRQRTPSAALAALGIEGRVLVVIESFETALALSFRNLPEVQLIKVGELNAYDVLCNDWIVFEQAAPADRRRPDHDRARAPTAQAEPLPEIDSPRTGRPTAPDAPPAEDGSAGRLPIKGNADSMLYHVPARRTRAHDRRGVVRLREAAEAAGFASHRARSSPTDGR
jgi:large subunit ribosomal protein L4